MAYFNGGATRSASSASLAIGQPLTNFGRRQYIPQTTTIHTTPALNTPSITHNDGDQDGEEIFTQLFVVNERYVMLPDLMPDSMAQVQQGSIAFTADPNRSRHIRAHSLPLMNALLYMMALAPTAKRITTIDAILEHFRLGGVMTTEQSTRSVMGTTHVAAANTAGMTQAMCRFLWTGKWQNVVDVWSDARTLFDHDRNPSWATALKTHIATDLTDGVELCVALIAMRVGFLADGTGEPFASAQDITAAAASYVAGTIPAVVFQFVPVALRRGVCVSPSMFAEPAPTFASDADAHAAYVTNGYVYPAAVWKIGQVHMRNTVDTITGAVLFPVPRLTLFPRDMVAAVNALNLCERRDKLPVAIRCMRVY